MSDWESLRATVGLTVRPLSLWPGRPTPAGNREKGPFTAPLRETLSVLKRELRELQARQIVLEVAIKEGHFRQDGLPRADARTTEPGVLLSFESKHGALRLHFDRFTRWENNLRAIALHLEHLRLASLYGVGRDGEQYKGWKALPAAPTASTSAPNATSRGALDVTTAAGAAAFFAQVARGGGITHNGGQAMTPEVVLRSAEAVKVIYRYGAMRLHPDKGGNAAEFRRLQTAYETLEKAA